MDLRQLTPSSPQSQYPGQSQGVSSWNWQTTSQAWFQAMIAEFLKYGIVGFINTCVDYVTFLICTVHFSYNPVPSNLISYNLGIAVSFLLNHHFTFRMTGHRFHMRKQIARFWMINLLSLSLSTGLVYLFSRWIASSVAKILSIPLVMIWGFLAMRSFVF
jgi:putative flippase GtrA